MGPGFAPAGSRAVRRLVCLPAGVPLSVMALGSGPPKE